MQPSGQLIPIPIPNRSLPNVRRAHSEKTRPGSLPSGRSAVLIFTEGSNAFLWLLSKQWASICIPIGKRNANRWLARAGWERKVRHQSRVENLASMPKVKEGRLLDDDRSWRDW